MNPMSLINEARRLLKLNEQQPVATHVLVWHLDKMQAAYLSDAIRNDRLSAMLKVEIDHFEMIV